MSDFDLDDLAPVLKCQDHAYRRDGCGTWIIAGKAGYIYAQPEGFYLYCDPGSKQAWTWAKKALDFCRLTEDGSEDGFFILERLPTEIECELIRDKLAIRKRRELGEDALRALRNYGDGSRFKPQKVPSDK